MDFRDRTFTGKKMHASWHAKKATKSTVELSAVLFVAWQHPAVLGLLARVPSGLE